MLRSMDYDSDNDRRNEAVDVHTPGASASAYIIADDCLYFHRKMPGSMSIVRRNGSCVAVWCSQLCFHRLQWQQEWMIIHG